MKKMCLILLGAVLLTTVPAKAQIPINSKRFAISNYFYPTTEGNYKRYYAHGFATQRTDQTRGRLFLLPILSWDRDKMEFIDEEGLTFDPTIESGKKARAILIPLNIHSKMPDKTQLPAIAAFLEHEVELKAYVPPMAKGPNNSFYILPQAMQLQPMLMQSAADHQRMWDEQQQLVNLYDNYSRELASLSQVEISLIIDGNIIASQLYDNTIVASGRNLTTIEVVSPTRYQQNRIANGSFRLVISYKFRDAHTSSISARFDAYRIVNHFLEETQRSMRSSSSSGWQVLGFGNRRMQVRSSMNSTVKENYSGENYEGTVIEMFDATDDMIAQFEREFFPELSKERVIENHIAAAEKARSNGNEALHDLHLQYASALQSSDPNLEVDMAAAVASLSAGDYAGFIANGVRWGSHDMGSNSSFRRVVHLQSEIQTHTGWTQVRTVSVQHALTENVMESKDEASKPRVGICAANQYTYPVYSQDMFGQLQTTSRMGLMPSCVSEGGPAYLAGIVPGMIISKIGGRTITTPTEFEELLEDYAPGDYLSFTIVDYQGFRMTERTIDVRLKAGAPMDGND